MSYCSATAIIINNPDLPQTNTISWYTATVATIDSHINRVDALINAKIAKRYGVPITPTPPLLATIAEDIVSFYTYRSIYAQDNQNTSERLGEYAETPEAQNAFALLQQIRDGELDLVNTAGTLIEDNATVVDEHYYSTNEDYTPIFDVDSPLDYNIDTDRLAAISEARK